MVVHKLNFCTTCFSIYHARTSGDADDYLLIERAADSASWKLRNERSGCAEDTAFGATYILSINEETRITLRQFYQCLVDCNQHRQLLSGTSWSILLPFGYIHDMFQDAFRRWLRLL